MVEFEYMGFLKEMLNKSEKTEIPAFEDVKSLLTSERASFVEGDSSPVEMVLPAKENKNLRSMVDGVDLDEKVKEPLNLMISYSEGPIIVDNLKNHAERRRWKKKMIKEFDWFNEFYRKNKLKVGRMSNALSAISVLKDLEGAFDEDLEFKNALDGVLDDAFVIIRQEKVGRETIYDLMNNEDRLKLVDNFDFLIEKVVKKIVS